MGVNEAVFSEILANAVEQGASDIFISAEVPVYWRRAGQLEPLLEYTASSDDIAGLFSVVADENIKKQFPSAIETSGSLFVNEIHSWFIPLDSSYYEISYPSSMVNCEKNIIDMIPISFNNNTVRRPLF